MTAELNIHGLSYQFEQSDNKALSMSAQVQGPSLGEGFPRHNNSHDWIKYYESLSTNPNDTSCVDPTIAINLVHKKYLEKRDALTKRKAQLAHLITSLDHWRQYNDDIVKFFQKDWRTSINDNLKNTQVAHSSKNIGDSSMREVMYSIQKTSFLEGQVSETVTAAEEVKNDIMSKSRSNLARIIDTCKLNRDNAQNTIENAKQAKKTATEMIQELDHTYSIAKGYFN